MIYESGVLVDPNLVAKVNRLCSDCDADVVISSSWGLNEDTLTCLIEAGATFNVIDGVAHPELNCPWLCRGNAIARWLAEHFDDNSEDYEYVILDDSMDFLMSQSDNLVVTNQNIGVCDKDIESCKRVLLRMSEMKK